MAALYRHACHEPPGWEENGNRLEDGAPRPSDAVYGGACCRRSQLAAGGANWLPSRRRALWPTLQPWGGTWLAAELDVVTLILRDVLHRAEALQTVLRLPVAMPGRLQSLHDQKDIPGM